jgi:hypothetical protein
LKAWLPEQWNFVTRVISSPSLRRVVLRYAAERRLHTDQPSLSRQIRDLEWEIGVKPLERRARGIALAAADGSFSIMRG